MRPSSPERRTRASLYRPRLVIFLTLLSIVLQIEEVCAASPDQKTGESSTTYLELYVNSSDPAHFSAVIERALRMSQTNLVPIGAIYHIGNHNNISPEIKSKVHAAKIRLYALTEVPSDLPLTTSPAWIFVTSSGRRIVEGTLSIGSFVDEQGEFRDGSNIRDPLADTPPEKVEKMEGF
jgi:hypothetical protein